MLGFFYIIFQYLGALGGGILIFDILNATARLGIEHNGLTPTYWTQNIFQEILGSTILVFLYLTQTEQKYELTTDPAIKMLIVSGAYCFSIFVGADTNKMSLSPVNPAIASGLIAADIFYGNWKSEFAWPYVVFPYAGSIIGVVVYEFLYKKAVDAVDMNENASLSSGDEEGNETFGYAENGASNSYNDPLNGSGAKHHSDSGSEGSD